MRASRSDRVAVIGVTLLAVVSSGCRSVRPLPLVAGTFVVDELNTAARFHGLALTVDLVANRARLQDGDQATELGLRRRPDQKQWRGGCGTMSDYALLETADVSPREVTVRGERLSLPYLVALCYREGAMLVDEHGSDRLMFVPAAAAR
jgi:hypothetical protein